MNCKQGDLAIIVRSFAGNEGKIVRCLRLANDGERRLYGFNEVILRGPVWVIDQDLITYRGDVCNLAHDAALRPIRDGDGTDETLEWAGKPAKEIA